MKTLFTTIFAAILALNAHSQWFELSGYVYFVNAVCYGANGSITVNPPSGTPPFLYKLNSGPYQSNNVFSNLWPGYYTVTIKDNTGDTTLVNAVVTGPANPLQVGITTTPDTSATYNNGSATAYATGGTPPYFYNWGNAIIGNTISQMPPGNYCLTVTDAAGCSFDTCITIGTGSVPYRAWANVTDASCHYTSDGSIAVTTTGGNPPFQYKLNNGSYQSSNVFGNLGAGLYNITVKDSLNQTAVTTAAVISPNPMFVNAGVSPASSTGAQDGFIIASVINGQSPYSFIWSNTDPTQNIFNLQQGNYRVTVTEATGCTATASFTVGVDNLPFFAFADITPIRCSGGSNGAINLTVEGDDAPYTYEWSTGSVNEDINNLTEGMYYVTISGANNFSFTDSIYLAEPGQLFTSGLIADVSCSGKQNGLIDVTTYGGTPPYTYEWNITGDSLQQDIFNLSAGAYFVTVLDARNCGAVSLYLVKEPGALSLINTSPPVNCALAATGPVAVAVMGGTKPYHYNWNNTSSTDSLIQGPPCGYNVQVIDSNGCTATLTFAVQSEGFATFATDTAICPGGSYIFRDTIYTLAGLYTDTVNNFGCGCDTLYTLELSERPIPVTTIYDTVVDVAQYTFGNQTITQSGTYYDTIVGANTCDSVVILNLSMQYSIGIKNTMADAVKIYPNPAKDKVMVTTGLTGATTYRVLDVQGRQVMQGTHATGNFEINTALLTTGYYFVTVASQDNEELKGRLIKE
ncbi:MAG TPA: T9SS type A sorting domain-containing protein [Chitinophagales bacterium]|nr:T9SS type A sorting domain-containing protein [Chitinophagales bacterium]